MADPIPMNEQPVLLPPKTVLILKPVSAESEGVHHVTYSFLHNPLGFSREELDCFEARDYELEACINLFRIPANRLDAPTQPA